MAGVFTVEQLRPIKDGMTISRDAKMGQTTAVTFFSLGNDTSISQERYDVTSIYIGAKGTADFLIGDQVKKEPVSDGDCLIVPGGTLCGVETATGTVYTEIIMKKETNMNSIVKSGEVMKLKDLISYEEGSIANLDVVSNSTMKFVLMAFDEGNAIVFALEGKATIGYEGKDYTLSAGENFRFDKNGLHSVTAQGKFKMALLLVLE